MSQTAIEPTDTPTIVVGEVANDFLEASDELKRLGKLTRAAEKRRDAASLLLMGELEEGQLINVGPNRYRFLHAVRNTPKYAEAFKAIKSVVDDAVGIIMDRALVNNTSESRKAKLEVIIPE